MVLHSIRRVPGGGCGRGEDGVLECGIRTERIGSFWNDVVLALSYTALALFPVEGVPRVELTRRNEKSQDHGVPQQHMNCGA